MVELSIIIPAYNEKGTIRKVIDKLRELPLKTQIIVVDDGSTDGTRAVSEKLKYPNLQVIYQPKNQGKGAAIRRGIKDAVGEYTVIQDADWEYSPTDLTLMYQYAVDNLAEVVYGNRFHSQRRFAGMGWANFWGNTLLAALASFLYGQVIHDEATCYKMFKTKVLKNINLKARRFEFCPEVTAKVRKKGYRIHEVPISYQPRTHASGKKLNAAKDGAAAIWTLLKYRLVD